MKTYSKVPDGYTRAHSARPYASAYVMAKALEDENRIVALVYTSSEEYEVYVEIEK